MSGSTGSGKPGLFTTPALATGVIGSALELPPMVSLHSGLTAAPALFASLPPPQSTGPITAPLTDLLEAPASTKASAAAGSALPFSCGKILDVCAGIPKELLEEVSQHTQRHCGRLSSSSITVIPEDELDVHLGHTVGFGPFAHHGEDRHDDDELPRLASTFLPRSLKSPLENIERSLRQMQQQVDRARTQASMTAAKHTTGGGAIAAAAAGRATPASAAAARRQKPQAAEEEISREWSGRLRPRTTSGEVLTPHREAAMAKDSPEPSAKKQKTEEKSKGRTKAEAKTEAKAEAKVDLKKEVKKEPKEPKGKKASPAKKTKAEVKVESSSEDEDDNIPIAARLEKVQPQSIPEILIKYAEECGFQDVKVEADEDTGVLPARNVTAAPVPPSLLSKLCNQLPFAAAPFDGVPLGVIRHFVSSVAAPPADAAHDHAPLAKEKAIDVDDEFDFSKQPSASDLKPVEKPKKPAPAKVKQSAEPVDEAALCLKAFAVFAVLTNDKLPEGAFDADAIDAALTLLSNAIRFLRRAARGGDITLSPEEALAEHVEELNTARRAASKKESKDGGLTAAQKQKFITQYEKDAPIKTTVRRVVVCLHSCLKLLCRLAASGSPGDHVPLSEPTLIHIEDVASAALTLHCALDNLTPSTATFIGTTLAGPAVACLQAAVVQSDAAGTASTAALHRHVGTVLAHLPLNPYVTLPVFTPAHAERGTKLSVLACAALHGTQAMPVPFGHDSGVAAQAAAKKHTGGTVQSAAAAQAVLDRSMQASQRWVTGVFQQFFPLVAAASLQAQELTPTAVTTATAMQGTTKEALAARGVGISIVSSFVEDLCTALALPEFPAADMLLRHALLAITRSTLKADSPSAAMTGSGAERSRAAAVDLVGKIALAAVEGNKLSNVPEAALLDNTWVPDAQRDHFSTLMRTVHESTWVRGQQETALEKKKAKGDKKGAKKKKKKAKTEDDTASDKDDEDALLDVKVDLKKLPPPPTFDDLLSRVEIQRFHVMSSEARQDATAGLSWLMARQFNAAQWAADAAAAQGPASAVTSPTTDRGAGKDTSVPPLDVLLVYDPCAAAAPSANAFSAETYAMLRAQASVAAARRPHSLLHPDSTEAVMRHVLSVFRAADSAPSAAGWDGARKSAMQALGALVQAKPALLSMAWVAVRTSVHDGAARVRETTVSLLASLYRRAERHLVKAGLGVGRDAGNSTSTSMLASPSGSAASLAAKPATDHGGAQDPFAQTQTSTQASSHQTAPEALDAVCEGIVVTLAPSLSDSSAAVLNQAVSFFCSALDGAWLRTRVDLSRTVIRRLVSMFDDDATAGSAVAAKHQQQVSKTLIDRWFGRGWATEAEHIAAKSAAFGRTRGPALKASPLRDAKKSKVNDTSSDEDECLMERLGPKIAAAKAAGPQIPPAAQEQLLERTTLEVVPLGLWRSVAPYDGTAPDDHPLCRLLGIFPTGGLPAIGGAKSAEAKRLFSTRQLVATPTVQARMELWVRHLCQVAAQGQFAQSGAQMPHSGALNVTPTRGTAEVNGTGILLRSPSRLRGVSDQLHLEPGQVLASVRLIAAVCPQLVTPVCPALVRHIVTVTPDHTNTHGPEWADAQAVATLQAALAVRHVLTMAPSDGKHGSPSSPGPAGHTPQLTSALTDILGRYSGPHHNRVLVAAVGCLCATVTGGGGAIDEQQLGQLYSVLNRLFQGTRAMVAKVHSTAAAAKAAVGQAQAQAMAQHHQFVAYVLRFVFLLSEITREFRWGQREFPALLEFDTGNQPSMLKGQATTTQVPQLLFQLAQQILALAPVLSAADKNRVGAIVMRLLGSLCMQSPTVFLRRCEQPLLDALRCDDVGRQQQALLVLREFLVDEERRVLVAQRGVAQADAEAAMRAVAAASDDEDDTAKKSDGEALADVPPTTKGRGKKKAAPKTKGRGKGRAAAKRSRDEETEEEASAASEGEEEHIPKLAVRQQSDQNSGMATWLMQHFHADATRLASSPYLSIRTAAYDVLELAVSQGLVAPLLFVEAIVHCVCDKESDGLRRRAAKCLAQIIEQHHDAVLSKVPAGVVASFTAGVALAVPHCPPPADLASLSIAAPVAKGKKKDATPPPPADAEVLRELVAHCPMFTAPPVLGFVEHAPDADDEEQRGTSAGPEREGLHAPLYRCLGAGAGTAIARNKRRGNLLAAMLRQLYQDGKLQAWCAHHGLDAADDLLSLHCVSSSTDEVSAFASMYRRLCDASLPTDAHDALDVSLGNAAAVAGKANVRLALAHGLRAAAKAQPTTTTSQEYGTVSVVEPEAAAVGALGLPSFLLFTAEAIAFLPMTNMGEIQLVLEHTRTACDLSGEVAHGWLQQCRELLSSPSPSSTKKSAGKGSAAAVPSASFDSIDFPLEFAKAVGVTALLLVKRLLCSDYGVTAAKVQRFFDRAAAANSKADRSDVAASLGLSSPQPSPGSAGLTALAQRLDNTRAAQAFLENVRGVRSAAALVVQQYTTVHLGSGLGVDGVAAPEKVSAALTFLESLLVELLEDAAKDSFSAVDVGDDAAAIAPKRTVRGRKAAAKKSAPAKRGRPRKLRQETSSDESDDSDVFGDSSSDSSDS